MTRWCPLPAFEEPFDKFLHFARLRGEAVSNGSSKAGNGHRRVTEAVKQPVLISTSVTRCWWHDWKKCILGPIYPCVRVKTGVKIEDIRDNYHTRSEKCGKLDCFKGINHTSRVKLRATFSLIVSHDILGSISHKMGIRMGV